MSHSSCLNQLHVRYYTMISRICNRNRSRLCKICRSFMHIWIRSSLRVRCLLKILLGIISHSNIVRHDQWPAFLYNLIQFCYYSYFYYLSLSLVKDQTRPPSFVKRTRHYGTKSIDYVVLRYILPIKHNKSSTYLYHQVWVSILRLS